MHLRMKWNVCYVLLETATLAYLFVHAFDPVRVIARFSLVALLSLGLSWWWDIKLRRRFLQEQQQQQVDRVQTGGTATAVAVAMGGKSGKLALPAGGADEELKEKGGRSMEGGFEDRGPSKQHIE